MSCLKDVPMLRGDNYSEWRKKVDSAFVCAEFDWVVETPQPVMPKEPEREAKDSDDDWERKKRDYARQSKVAFSQQEVHGLLKEHN